MKQKITEYIKKEVSMEDIEDLELTDDLLGSGIIDSMGMMKLIDYIEKELDISIPQEDLIVENFMSIERIMVYLEQK